MRRSVFVCIIIFALCNGPGEAEGRQDRGVEVQAGAHDRAALLAESDPGPLADVSSSAREPGTAYVARAAPAGGGSLELPTLQSLQTILEELLDPGLRPLSLVSGDLDEDGIEDLVCGHGGTGNVLSVHRGNVDALYPNSPGARQRKSNGLYSDAPFLSPARLFPVPGRPDFIEVGDFNNDGHLDLAVATRGAERVHLIAGDGTGGLHAARPVALGGSVTAMLAGEINRPDGLRDLVVAVATGEGAEVLVFEGPDGALVGEPERLPMPAPVDTLALRRLDKEPFVDLAIGAGHELVIVHGRDRRLSLPRGSRGEVDPAVVERKTFAEPIDSVVAADLVWEPRPRSELAVLTADGVVHVLSPERARGGHQRDENDDSGEPSRWTEIFESRVIDDGQDRSPRPALLAARMSGSAVHDLLIIDRSGHRVHALTVWTEETGAPGTVQPQKRHTSEELGSEIDAMIPMRLGPDALDDLVLVVDGALAVAPMAPAATIVVDSPADFVLGGDGACTLREAINNANSNTDTTSGDCAAGTGNDMISFNILGGGVAATITPTTPLPPIADPVVIDGTTQGCSSPPCVELNGSLAGAPDVDGLQLEAGGNTVRGLVINRFSRHGILVLSSGNIIEGNYMGTNIAGDTVLGNGVNGVRVITGSDNMIGGATVDARNLLSGNGGAGLQLREMSTANRAIGNYIGTDIGGTVDLGNTEAGVGILLESDGNTIGGTAPGEGNLISGNETRGINAEDSDMILVQGNMVGTNASGTAAVGNTSVGIWVEDGTDNTIGGTALGARNVISGNASAGVLIAEINAVPTTGNLIQGNFIGTNVSGTSAVPNSLSGIIIRAKDNIVGGTGGARNVISGNGQSGVFIVTAAQLLPPAEGNQVLNNYIGTNVTGSAALSNDSQGVAVRDSPNNVIGAPDEGNLISGNVLNGILLYQLADAPLGPTTGNVVEANLIGTDASGMFDLGNAGNGVSISRSPSNTVGGTTPGTRNVISGNAISGIGGFNASDDVLVQGNFIGTDITGESAIANDGSGIRLQDCSRWTIGGTAPEARNVISGNVQDGVFMFQTAGGVGADNVVQGNYIGTDVTGTVDLGNLLAGVEIQLPTNNTIGGTAPGARNIISGNAIHGILLETTSGNRVLGNYIGTDATGRDALGNDRQGLRMFSASDNLIGGPGPGAGNVISNSGLNGIQIDTDSFLNVVQGNYIGTGPNVNGGALKTIDLGNALAGVNIMDSSTNTVGGVNPGEGNIIGYNGMEGVVVQGVVAENAILGNSISSNGLLGIDLGADGVTANDTDDPDVGPNLLQNFPELSLAVASPIDLLLEGTLNSVARADFRLEFFANATCDGSLHGEGQRFIGFVDATTNGAGNAAFSMVFPAQVSDGDQITATATEVSGNSSEFSACLTAACTTIVTFAQTIVAPDKNTLMWTTPINAQFAKGDLSGVSTYATTATGPLFGTAGFDISGDAPAAGNGLYYVFKPLGCGSWRTMMIGEEPGRDIGLP